MGSSEASVSSSAPRAQSENIKIAVFPSCLKLLGSASQVNQQLTNSISNSRHAPVSVYAVSLHILHKFLPVEIHFPVEFRCKRLFITTTCRLGIFGELRLVPHDRCTT
jgi:hypothetical protein